jgi:hypothetical protein
MPQLVVVGARWKWLLGSIVQTFFNRSVVSLRANPVYLKSM